MRYRLAEGARFEPLEVAWAAYSGLSGETLQLNTEAAAILELLTQGPMHDYMICEALAIDTQCDPVDVGESLRHVWGHLVSCGLVCVEREPA